MNLTVACVLKSGGIYTPEYVHRLYHMVQGNISYDFEFACLTDYAPENFQNQVKVIPFEVDFAWKWCKINLWNPENPFQDRILFLDLDNIILQSLDPIVEFDADFALPEQWKKNMKPRFGRQRNLNYKTPVMVWNHNARPELWNDFNLGKLFELVGDQDWVGERLPGETTLPAGWFDEQRYYNKREEIPEKCIVLGITTKGKNKEACRKYEWIRKIWGNLNYDKRSLVSMPLKKKVIVACFLWGDWFNGLGEEYVKILRDSVARNLSLPHKFVCLTDQEISDDGIETLPIYAPSTMGNLTKLALYNPTYGFDDRMVCMDIDLVVTGDLDEMFSYDGEIATRAAFRSKEQNWVPDGDMSVQNMSYSRRYEIWDKITRQISKIEKNTSGAERKFYKQWTRQIWPDMDFIQELFPGQLLSFKQDNIRGQGLSKNTRLVSFHGKPKPHELDIPWIKRNWRRNKGGSN